MEHYIIFEGAIDAINSKKLSDVILGINSDPAVSQNATKINLFISSYGGSIYHGFALATIIQNSRIPISIHSTNHIDSIANIVFLAAKVENRTSESHAKFFVHGASREGSFDERGLKEALSSIKTENHRIATYISENSKLTLEEVRDKMQTGETMSAKDALQYGYISQLGHKTIPSTAPRYDIISLPL